MTKPRVLRFDNEKAVEQDVLRLKNGYHQQGQWTLAQACYHLKLALEKSVHPPATTQPSPEQVKAQQPIHQFLKAGVMPERLPIAPGTEPPADADEKAIDELLAGLEALKNYDQSHVDFGQFGPLPTEHFRRFICIHSSNHLKHLVPVK